MKAEALIGTVLGTCTLQKIIGQGGMGAVFLAQQSRPRRQVAVKVLLPATSLKPHQRTAFLERFRRETDAAASLEHPHILPVHESGGRLLLTDFGLVKIIADGQTPQMRLTGAGVPVGTPDYMSPEQVIGEVVDGRSDLYS